MMPDTALLSGFIAASLVVLLIPGPGVLYVVARSARCLVPVFNGAIFSLEWKDALWDKFYTAAPQRLRRFVELSRIVKKA